MIDISNLKRWDCCCKDVDCMGSGPGLPNARFVKFEDVLELLKQADNSGYTKCQCKVPSIPVGFTQMEKSSVKCTVCGGHFA